MKIALVGCGYVADYYMATLRLHPRLRLVGACDKSPERCRAFGAFYGVPTFPTIKALLDATDPELVLNLTDPASHYEVSKLLLEAGRHVYTEKPLAMDFEQAQELTRIADSRNLSISGAPCTIHGDSARRVWQALTEGLIGQVRLVYASLEDGMVFRTQYANWRSASGAPWPYQDEFALGCTVVHAGYWLSWLLAYFGPVKRMTAHTSCLFPDKGLGQTQASPDFSVASLVFSSGVVARLTCGLVAPADRSMHIIGDKGTLTIANAWDNRSAIHFQLNKPEMTDVAWRARNKIKKLMLAGVQRFAPGAFWGGRRLALAPGGAHLRSRTQKMDFLIGVEDQAIALDEGGTPLISANHLLHATELVLAIHNSDRLPQPYTPQSRFDHDGIKRKLRSVGQEGAMPPARGNASRRA